MVGTKDAGRPVFGQPPGLPVPMQSTAPALLLEAQVVGEAGKR
jgi:hypothetical protein